MRSLQMNSDSCGIFIKGVLLRLTPEVREKSPLFGQCDKLFFLGQISRAAFQKYKS